MASYLQTKGESVSIKVELSDQIIRASSRFGLSAISRLPVRIFLTLDP